MVQRATARTIEINNEPTNPIRVASCCFRGIYEIRVWQFRHIREFRLRKADGMDYLACSGVHSGPGFNSRIPIKRVADHHVGITDAEPGTRTDSAECGADVFVIGGLATGELALPGVALGLE
jgi:hypothetical protein